MEACSERKPDVFISFGGVDIRSSFKSHFYAALCHKHIDAYGDDQFREGDEISPVLLKTIENSKISVIIFTENYASSKWCLDELVKIIKCKSGGQIVIPIFYNLDPSEVRYQKGSYREAFDKHENTYKVDSVKLQEWRTALLKAADLSGWHSSLFRDEHVFIDAIVKDLIEKLNHTGSSNEYRKGLVGIDEHIAKLESLMSSNETLPLVEVKIIGLWGMGGIGKTTIATALYKKVSSKYEGSCFLENVREEWEKAGSNKVRKDFLSKLLKENNIQHFADPMGKDFTLTRLQRKRAFIVLDDLNDPNQLDYIIGGKNNYGPGSRIVVTTRNRQVFNNKFDKVYNVQEMDYHKALELFSLFAFPKEYPSPLPPIYADAIESALTLAAGNPLALKAYGSLLGKTSIGEWKGSLQKIYEIQDTNVMKVLRFSYDSLSPEEKNIFLDIACFFKGERKDRIIDLLNGCGLLAEIGLKNLQDKSLLAISSTHEIWMHDLIHKMGEKIVHEKCEGDPVKCSRLWDPNDIYRILNYNLGSEAVEGMFLDMSKIKEVRLKPDFFSKMYKLRFLSFRASNDNKCNVLLNEDLHFLPENLRILHWERYPRKFLPSKYDPEKLIELNLSHSKLEKLWDGVVDLPNLRSINLSFCEHLAELPDLSEASKLKDIDIEDCTSLQLIPSSVFKIDSLATINARGCHGVTFPEGEDHDTSLERINFSGCSSLEEFSVNCEIATFLDLSGTAIKELSPTIGYCNKLIELHLRDCKSLQDIPESFSQLECLEILDLSNCQKVAAEALFSAIKGFKSLKILKLENCLSLSKLPSNFSKLSSLNLLSLSGSSISSLPSSVKDLPLLKDLALKDCKKLKDLPDLPPSIQRLNASGCISLSFMSNLYSNYKNIQAFESMSEEEILKQIKGGYPEEWFFYNCIKLNGRAVNSLLEGAKFRIQRAAFISSVLDVSQLDNILIRICLPRSEVPDWFSLQAVESSICCQLPAHSVFDLNRLRFAFCFVVDTCPWDDESKGKALTLSVGYKCYFPALKRGWFGSSSDFFLTQLSGKEHMYIWYDDALGRCIMNGAADQRSHLEITFEFDAKINGLNRVKKCGVLVLNKYLNKQANNMAMKEASFPVEFNSI